MRTVTRVHLLAVLSSTLGLGLIACGGDRFASSTSGAGGSSVGGSAGSGGSSGGVGGGGVDSGVADGGDAETPGLPDADSSLPPTPLEVTSVSPAKGATQVIPTISISATFSQPLKAATVTKTSFTVQGAGQMVLGDVSYANGVAKFTPAQPLTLLTTYAATLGATISDVAGNTLPNPYAWSFTTIEGKWGTPGVIELNAGDAELPQVAVDGSGNAIAVWAHSDGTRKNIWSNRFKPVEGWQTAELLEMDNAGDARFPRVAVDSTGNAVAVWMQSDGTHSHIRSSYFTAGAKWSPAVSVENNPAGDAVTPSIAMDERGHAIAVWSQSDGVVDSLWTSRMTWADRLNPAFGWSTPELLEHDDAGNAGPYTPNPNWIPAPVKMDPAGDALVVWSQGNGPLGAPGTVYSIWSNRYTPDTGWGKATRIQPANGSGDEPELAMNASGNAVTVWIENGQITANRFSLSTGWGATTTVIETNNAGHAFDPDVAIDPAGNALVVWDRYDGILRNHLWSNTFKADTGWGQAKLIEGDGPGRTDYPHIGVDSSGNGIVVWQQSDGARPNIWANRFDHVNGWGTAALVETDNAGPAQSPVVAVSPGGSGIAVWQQSDGAQSKILSAYFH